MKERRWRGWEKRSEGHECQQGQVRTACDRQLCLPSRDSPGDILEHFATRLLVVIVRGDTWRRQGQMSRDPAFTPLCTRNSPFHPHVVCVSESKKRSRCSREEVGKYQSGGARTVIVNDFKV